MVTISEQRDLPALAAEEPGEEVERLIALDGDAWHAFYDRYFRRIYGYAFVRTGQSQAAEEIAAEVFAAAAGAIRRYRPTGAPIGAWLYRIARNRTADHLDQQRRQRTHPLEGIELAGRPWATQVEERADLLRGLAGLKREQQVVIALRFFSDCSLEETAATLGKSIGAVKTLQHRALASLRRRLTREDPRR